MTQGSEKHHHCDVGRNEGLMRSSSSTGTLGDYIATHGIHIMDVDQSSDVDPGLTWVQGGAPMVAR